MNQTESLERLAEMHARGALSDEEYQQAKAQMLTSGTFPNERQWAMILHLSQLAGYAVPYAGFVAPIVIWQINKESMPALDEHGRNIANWLISFVIYSIAFGFLCIFVVGLPLLLGLWFLGVAFPIIGTIKASNNEVWRYPLSIRFF